MHYYLFFLWEVTLRVNDQRKRGLIIEDGLLSTREGNNDVYLVVSDIDGRRLIKVYEREKSFGEIVLREHFLKEAREAIKVIGMPDYMLKYEERVIR